MRTILCLVILMTALGTLRSQTVFWTESFENGCTAGCLANGSNTGNGAWSVVALSTAPGNALDAPNEWYVSCAENGHTNTVCGSGCAAITATATRATLHVGSTSAGDIGAAYDAGGVCGFFYCTNTHKQASSPVISTTGYSGITVGFDYIEFGATTNDDMYAFQYSTNSGTSWTTLVNPVKTACCGGACNGSRQGQWTHYSAALPAACDNIATFRLCFIWKNNDDGIGTDPSFAVDNLTLSYTSSLPVELTSFAGIFKNEVVFLDWNTATETDNSKFVIERSADAVLFDPIGDISGAGTSIVSHHYSFIDAEPLRGVNYYRLKQVDFNGKYAYSPLTAVSVYKEFYLGNILYDEREKTLRIDLTVFENIEITAEIFDASGKLLVKSTQSVSTDDHLWKLDGLVAAKGVYYLRITSSQAVFGRRMIF